MMKIQVNEDGEQVILQIEGRLAGPFVEALEDCAERAGKQCGPENRR
jgi:hypothetical protein